MEPIKVATIIICILGIGYTALALWIECRQEKQRKDFIKKVNNFKISNYENEPKTKGN